MIPSSNAKHPDHVEQNTEQNSFPRNSCEEGEETSQVETKKRQTLKVTDAVFSARRRLLGSNDCAHEFPNEMDLEKLSQNQDDKNNSLLNLRKIRVG